MRFFPTVALGVCALWLAPCAAFAKGEAAARFSAKLWFEKRAGVTAEAARLRHAHETYAAQARSPAENVTVPVETWPDGSVKASVFAARAQFFLDAGFVWGEGVVIRQFSAAGEVQAEVQARSCVVDRATRSGWAEGPASVRHGGTIIEGDGVYFSLRDEYVMIAANTRITSTDLKLGGLKL